MAARIGGAGAKKRMTPAQCRAARLMADMTQAELAAIAVLPATLITDFETGVGAPEPRDLDEIKREPLALINKPIHSLLWYLSRATFNMLADQASALYVDELHYKPGVPVVDDTIKQLSMALMLALHAPERDPRPLVLPQRSGFEKSSWLAGLVSRGRISWARVVALSDMNSGRATPVGPLC
jgi:hypothetical protein